MRRQVLKLSPGKHTLAGVKQVWRTPAAGVVTGDVISLSDEIHHDGRSLLQPVLKRGQPVGPLPSIDDSRSYCLQCVAELPPGVRRLKDWEGRIRSMSVRRWQEMTRQEEGKRVKG